MLFQWPLLLFSLCIVPVVVVFYILAQRRRRTYTVRFTNLALLQSVAGKGPGIRRHIPPLLFLLALVALLISLARPTAVIAVPRDQATVLLVIDTSGSMEARDMQPTRMEAAKQAARKFVETLPPNIQVGVISFSGSANMRTPLTQDHDEVMDDINRLTALGATAIGDGLNLALDQIQELPETEGDQGPPATIVLLSDGANSTGSSPSDAAVRARNERVTVNTVGIGARGFGTGRSQWQVGLDETALQRIASTTGGRYYYAAETGTLEQIYSELSSHISWQEERTEITSLISALSAIILMASVFLGLRWFQRFP